MQTPRARLVFNDAVGQRPELKLIIALQEGQATAMAHGYELASGRTATLFMPSIGMPNTLCNLYNAWKDRSSLLVFFRRAEFDADRPRWFSAGGRLDAAHRAVYKVALAGKAC